jgi:hypothetical protein
VVPPSSSAAREPGPPGPERFRAAFAPLSAGDRQDLQRFVRKVDALVVSPFMQQRIGLTGEHVPGQSYLGGPAWSIGVTVPDEPSVKAVIADFRILYTDANRCSAMRVLRLLQTSAHRRGAPEGREAIEALKKIRAYLKTRRRHDPVGHILDEDDDGVLVDRSPEDIIDLWFNGEYFHDDQDKAEQLEGEQRLDVEMLRIALHTAIRDHVRAWMIVRNTADGVLTATGVPDGA